MLRKTKIVRIFNKTGVIVNLHKRDIPLNKEWYNSIYAFNKNPIRFLPAVHDYVFKLLKSHFNMINKNMEVIIKSRKFKKVKRSLGNKVWVSTPEIKHLNKEITITVYIYNRLYNQYKKQLSFANFAWGPKIKSDENKTLVKFASDRMANKKIEVMKHKYPTYLATNKKVHNKSENFYIKMIKWLKLDKHNNTQKYKLDIIKLVKKNKLDLLKGLNLLKTERYNYLINQFKKELIYLKLKQKMLFNEFKFTELYLTTLIDFLQTIYVKKVKINVIMLKYYYLSSSILSQMILAKVISLKNRGQPLRPVYHAMEYTFIPNLSSNKLRKIDKLRIGMQNVIFDKLKITNKNHDSLNKFLLTNSNKSKIWSSKYIDSLVLKNLENKSIAGLFIKLAGRLTKRYKAQRAVSYLRYKGTLKNVYSSHKGYSSALSRGFSNINVEKTMIHSKVRIGAFGITGWVASY